MEGTLKESAEELRRYERSTTHTCYGLRYQSKVGTPEGNRGGIGGIDNEVLLEKLFQAITHTVYGFN